MEGIWDWGVGVILWLQQFSPALDLPFKFFTFMGEEPFFLLLLPLVYWCLDRRTGARLTVAFLLSAYTNGLVKALAAQPRPVDYAPDRVHPLWEIGGYGFPSGHTQNAVVVWGYLATQLRRTWMWIVAGLLLVFIPLSRVYLGVHFPTDLLGGYLIGAILLLLYLRFDPSVESWLKEKGLAWQLGAAVGAPALLMLLYPTEGGITAAATLMGMAAGFALERRWVGFDVGGVWWRRAVRFLVGAAVLVGLYGGLRAAFSGLEPAFLFRLVRYVLVGLWGGVGAPWLFVRLGLAKASAD